MTSLFTILSLKWHETHFFSIFFSEKKCVSCQNLSFGCIISIQIKYLLQDANGVSGERCIFVSMKKIYYLLMGCLLLAGCSQKPHDITMVQPVAYRLSRLRGRTVPANIAPLNFCMEDEGYTAMSVQIKESRKGAMETSGRGCRSLTSNNGINCYVIIEAEN